MSLLTREERRNKRKYFQTGLNCIKEIDQNVEPMCQLRLENNELICMNSHLDGNQIEEPFNRILDKENDSIKNIYYPCAYDSLPIPGIIHEIDEDEVYIGEESPEQKKSLIGYDPNQPNYLSQQEIPRFNPSNQSYPAIISINEKIEKLLKDSNKCITKNYTSSSAIVYNPKICPPEEKTLILYDTFYGTEITPDSGEAIKEKLAPKRGVVKQGKIDLVLKELPGRNQIISGIANRYKSPNYTIDYKGRLLLPQFVPIKQEKSRIVISGYRNWTPVVSEKLIIIEPLESIMTEYQAQYCIFNRPSENDFGIPLKPLLPDIPEQNYQPIGLFRVSEFRNLEASVSPYGSLQNEDNLGSLFEYKDSFIRGVGGLPEYDNIEPIELLAIIHIEGYAPNYYEIASLDSLIVIEPLEVVKLDILEFTSLRISSLCHPQEIIKLEEVYQSQKLVRSARPTYEEDQKIELTEILHIVRDNKLKLSLFEEVALNTCYDEDQVIILLSLV